MLECRFNETTHLMAKVPELACAAVELEAIASELKLLIAAVHDGLQQAGDNASLVGDPSYSGGGGTPRPPPYSLAPNEGAAPEPTSSMIAQNFFAERRANEGAGVPSSVIAHRFFSERYPNYDPEAAHLWQQPERAIGDRDDTQIHEPEGPCDALKRIIILMVWFAHFLHQFYQLWWVYIPKYGWIEGEVRWRRKQRENVIYNHLLFLCMICLFFCNSRCLKHFCSRT